MSTNQIDPWISVLAQFEGVDKPSISAVRAALGFSTERLVKGDVLRELFMTLPIDEKSFVDQYPDTRVAPGAELWGRTVLIDKLMAWFTSVDRPDLCEDDNLTIGTIGFLVLTLVGLVESERLSMSPATRRAATADEPCHKGFCERLVRSSSARSIIDLVYDDKTDAEASQNWQLLRLETLNFHKHGSTSMLVLVQQQGDRTPLALKLVLAPFLRMPEIRHATKLYKRRYSIANDTSQPAEYTHLVDVRSSADCWILMDLVVGETLTEYLARRRRPSGSSPSPDAAAPESEAAPAPVDGRLRDGVQLEQMKVVGEALWRALEENWTASHAASAAGMDRPVAHGDLSPSNVVIRADMSCVLVDYGPNYLYTRTARGGGDSEAVFVAPEIRANGSYTGVADVYSLGQILILAGGLTPDARGIVPDELYMWHPNVARLLEDYLDANPRRRLTSSGRGAEVDDDKLATRWRYQFKFELDMAIKLQQEPGLVGNTLPTLLREQRLWNGEPGRYRTLLKMVETWRANEQKLDGYAPAKIDEYISTQRATARWLYWWSMAVAFMTGYSSLTVTWWLFRDLRIGWGPEWLVPLQYLFLGGSDGFPGVDALRAPGYVVPDLAHNWPARAIGLSYALVAAKVYQTVYARIAPIRAHGGPGLSTWPVLAEVWMRFMPTVNTFLVLLVTIVGADLWPAATILGQLLIAVGNFVVMRFIGSALKKGREHHEVGPGLTAPLVSTVPRTDSEITGLDLIGSWVPSSILFAIMSVVVGALIYLGKLSDVGLYATMIAFINIFLIYVVKCGFSGPKFRVACHRAAFCAERLKLPEVDDVRKPALGAS